MDPDGSSPVKLASHFGTDKTEPLRQCCRSSAGKGAINMVYEYEREEHPENDFIQDQHKMSLFTLPGLIFKKRICYCSHIAQSFFDSDSETLNILFPRVIQGIPYHKNQ